MLATTTRAAALPGPPELLPGRPDAVIDLQTADGARLAGAQWRYSDARVETIDFVDVGGPADPDPPNRTYDVLPHAQAGDFDDSAWAILAPEDTMRRLGIGGIRRAGSSCSAPRAAYIAAMTSIYRMRVSVQGVRPC